MKRLDHETYREWLHLECDGELLSADRSLLRQHLGSCAEVQLEYILGATVKTRAW